MAVTVLGEYSSSAPATSHVVPFAASTPGKTLIVLWYGDNALDVTVAVGTLTGKNPYGTGAAESVYVTTLDGYQHTTSLTSITFTLSVAEPLSAVILEEDAPAITNLRETGNAGAGTNYTTTSWETGDTTVDGDKCLAAFFGARNDATAVTDFHVGFDKGFATIADSGSGATSRLWVGEADNVAWTDDGVTMTTTDSSEIALAVGLLIVYDIPAPPLTLALNSQFTQLDAGTTAKSMPLDFTPTAGSLLVAAGVAPATFSTPVGWTRGEEYLASWASVVFTKTADGTETSIDWTQNGARVAQMAVWEFPAGSTVSAQAWRALGNNFATAAETIGPVTGQTQYLDVYGAGAVNFRVQSRGDQVIAYNADTDLPSDNARMLVAETVIADGDTADTEWFAYNFGDDTQQGRMTVTVPPGVFEVTFGAGTNDAVMVASSYPNVDFITADQFTQRSGSVAERTNTAFGQIGLAEVALGACAMRYYARRTVNGGGDVFLSGLVDSADGDTMSTMRVRSNNELQLRDEFTAEWTSADGVMPDGQWVRIEQRFDPGAQTQDIRVFSGANIEGTIPDVEQLGVSMAANVAQGPLSMRLGGQSSTPASTVQYRDVGFNATGEWIGSKFGAPWNPRDLPWNAALWADQPGFTPPADGATIPAGPDNLGSVGAAAWTVQNSPTWVEDIGQSKPAFGFPTNAYLTNAGQTGIGDRCVVVVGRVLDVANADLFDSGPQRTALDSTGGSWRTFAGTNMVGPAADTDLHLFIAVFDATAGQNTLYIDGTQANSQAGSVGVLGTAVTVGASTLGDFPHNGSEVAFVGLYDGLLSAQDRANLYDWYYNAYVNPAGSPPSDVTARGSADGRVDLTWSAVADSQGYRLYVDGVEDTEAGLISGTSYTVTGLVAGQMYSFQLVTVRQDDSESDRSVAVNERAAKVYTSIQSNLYSGYNPTPLVDSFQGGQQAIEWGEHCAFHTNARDGGQHFSWYKDGTTDPIYNYAHEFLDGATVAWRSGGSVLVIEWNLGDDAWRQTLLANPGDQMTIDYSDDTVNQGAQGVVTGPFNSTLIEHEGGSGATFEVWVWGVSVPAPPPPPRPVVVDATWREVLADASNASSYSFPAVDIGADTDIAAIVWVRGLSDMAPVTITVDGTTITPTSERSLEDTGGGAWSYVAAIVATDLTGPIDVVVSTTTSGLRCGVALWSMDGVPATVDAGVAHDDEVPAFVTSPGALLTASYVDGVNEYAQANASGLTQRANVDVETDNRLLVADDVTDTGLTYLRTNRTSEAWTFTAWMTLNTRASTSATLVRDENALAGTTTGYSIPGNGTVGYLGYARQFSVDAGETIDFAVDGVDAAEVAIFRKGHYGGDGQRLVATVTNTGTDQAAGVIIANSNDSTRMLWNTTASWAVPSDAVSGLYIGVVRDSGGNPYAWMPFVVRNDSRDADIVVKMADSTWGAAYNHFGDVGSEFTGKSVYGSGGALGSIAARGHAMSYDRPIVTRGTVINHWDNHESALIDWLEENGYDVKYIGSYDLDQQDVVDVLGGSRMLVSAGHDEYWSDGMRDNAEAFRDAGGHLLFMSGNEVFWRVRWADGGRTMWCYKDTMPGPGAHAAGTPLDPVSWTGTFRDTRRPGGPDSEHLLTGTFFRMNNEDSIGRALTVNASIYGSSPFWRNTTVAEGTDLVTGVGIVGFEADEVLPPDSGYQLLVAQQLQLNGSFAGINGQDYGGTGTITWGLIGFLASPTAGLTVGFATTQWMWGLSNVHRRGSAVANLEMRQATTNLLYDLGAVASSLQLDLNEPAPESLVGYGITHTGINPNPPLTVDPPDTGSFFQPGVPPSATTISDPENYMLGTRFTVSTDGKVDRLWFYKQDPSDPGAQELFLLDQTGGGLIMAQVSIDAGTNTGWVGVNLPSPVNVFAGNEYLVGYTAPAAYDYAFVADFAGTTNGPITALPGGWFRESATVVAGGGTGFTSNYLADISYTVGTVEAPPGQSGSIWYPTALSPAAASDGLDLALLTRFTVSGSGTIQRLYYYKAWAGDQSPVTMFLLDASNEIVLGQVGVNWGTEQGWVSADLVSPVSVGPGTIYAVGILVPGADSFSVETNVLAADIVNGSITARAPATYKYTSTVDTTGYVPASDGRAYYADVAFVAAGAGGQSDAAVGAAAIADAKLGSAQVQRMYVGSTMIFDRT